MRVLITGGAGFLGHHVVEHILVNTDWHIVIIDKLTYASMGLERIREVSECFSEKRLTILATDFANSFSHGIKKEIGDIDYIIHIGAETHVDESIKDPEKFVMSNLVGTYQLLEFARECKNLKKFVYFSTDEVYGPATEVPFKETDRYNSTNPYSATKAGAEQLVLAWVNTYNVPAVIVNSMNIFGERQHKEKFIPLCISNMLHNKWITIHTNGDKTKPGVRSWIHARNVADAILFVIEHGKNRESYNIVGQEFSNLKIAEFISTVLNHPLHYTLESSPSNRPGHDFKYSLDGSKLTSLGWQAPVDVTHSLRKTILWTLANRKWIE